MEMLGADELLQPALPYGLNAVYVGKVGLAHAGTPTNIAFSCRSHLSQRGRAPRCRMCPRFAERTSRCPEAPSRKGKLAFSIWHCVMRSRLRLASLEAVLNSDTGSDLHPSTTQDICSLTLAAIESSLSCPRVPVMRT